MSAYFPRVVARAEPGVVVLPAVLLGTGLGVVLTVVALRLPERMGPGVLVTIPLAFGVLALGLHDQRWGWALFAAALPVGLTSLAGGVQVVQVLAAVAVALVMVGRVRSGRSPLRLPPAAVALLLLVGWSVLTTPVAIDVSSAVRWNAALLIGWLLLAATVSAVDGSLNRLRQLTLILLAGSVVTCAFALPQSATRDSFGAAVVEGRALGVFDQPNELGLFAGTATILALAAWAGGPVTRYRRLERVGVGAGATISVAALLLSLSRGAWLGSLLALAVVMALAHSVRRSILAVVGACAFAGLLLTVTGSLPPQLDVIGARAEIIADRQANPYDERPAIWSEGLRAVRDNPGTGVGAANFPDASAQSSSPVAAAARPAHAHNVLLNVTAEGGVPAGLALVVAAFLTGRGVMNGRRRCGWGTSQRSFLVAVGCSPLVIFGQGLLDAPIRNPTTLLQIAAATGLAIAVPSIRPRDDAGKASSLPVPRQTSPSMTDRT